MNIGSASRGLKSLVGPCVLGLGLALAAPAWAQKAYRCGTVYQDRPCATAQADGKVVNTTGAGQAVASDPRVDAECARRGNAAQRMAWARESGKTEQEQAGGLAGEQRELLAEVYRRRGSSVDVRKSIEADCMADKERAAAQPAQAKGDSRSAANPGTPPPPPAPAPGGPKPGV